MDNCINCNRNVRSCYYVPDKSLCNVCDKILKGGNKKCRVCKEEKEISLFERPYLTRCKQCSNKASKEHYKQKEEHSIKCECGKLVSYFYYFDHLETKSHLAFMEAKNCFN